MKEAIKEVDIEEIYNENEHIIDMEAWEPLDFKIDESYKYVPKSKIFEKCSHLLYYGVAVPVLYVLTKVIYDLKIEGKEHLRDLEGGAVSVSNHVLFLDCAMVGLAMDDKKIFYTTLEDSFKIPVVRKLIKLLRALPIPKENKNKPHFMNAVDEILQNGDVVHFYPEASLWPYYDKIRNFKTGAFRFAIRNDVPIIPMVFTFRRPGVIRRRFKKKPDVTLTILEPIKGDGNNEDTRQKINSLRREVYEAMENCVVEKKGKKKVVK